LGALGYIKKLVQGEAFSTMNAIPVGRFGSVVLKIYPIARSGTSGFLIDLSADLFRKDLDAWVTECG
jgi:hypothetical protein